MTPQSKMTLHSVATALMKRLGTKDKPAKPLTLKAKEEQEQGGRQVVVHGIEIKFDDLPGERVLKALQGLEVITPLRKANPGSTFTHRGAYYANNPKIAFSLEVRRYRDSSICFMLTNMKFDHKFVWLTETRGEIKMRGDTGMPEVAPEGALEWKGPQLQELMLQIGPCGKLVNAHHNGKVLEVITTL